MTLPSVNPLPTPGALTLKNGGISTSGYQFLQSLYQGAVAALSAVSTINGNTYGETFAIGGSLANQDYDVAISVPFGFTVSNITSRCRSGTCTATFKINGTPLGGTANAVSTSKNPQAQASANVLDVGDDFTCTISSNASCVDADFMITYTRT